MKVRNGLARRAALVLAALVLLGQTACEALFDTDGDGEPDFRPAVRNTSGGGGGGVRLPSPRIAMDGSGDGMAVWAEDRDLFAVRYRAADDTWEGKTRIAAGVGDGEELGVVMRFGNAMVAWEQGRSVQTLEHDPLGGWQSVPTAHGDGLDPRLATNTRGGSSMMHGAWRRIVPVDAFVDIAAPHAEARFPGAGWTGVTQRLDTNDIQATDPKTTLGLRIAMDGFGEAFAIWTQQEMNGADRVHGIVAARGRDATWGKAGLVSFGLGSATAPDVAADVDGNALAVWEQDGDIHASFYDVTTHAWRIPEQIDDYVGTPFAPRVEMSGNGRGIAAWWSSDGRIYATRYVPGPGWSPPQPVDVDVSGNRLSGTSQPVIPAVGIDEDGNARIVWSFNGGINTVRYDVDLGWEFAERVASGSNVDLDMDQTGRAIAVWWNRGLGKRVWAPGAEPPPPPASGRMAFASYRDGDFEIFAMDPDGSNVVQLTRNTASDRAPAWSPDGTRIAFVSDRDGQPPGSADLYILDVATGGLSRRTFVGEDGGVVRNPAWDPNGDWIACVMGGPGFGGIALIDLDSPVHRSLTTDAEDRGPAWSPDGSQIVISRRGDLLLLDPDLDSSQTPGLLLDEAYDAVAPAWSPDGTLVAFAAKGSAQGIHTLKVANGEVAPLTDRDDDMPAWSSDGGRIAFVWTASADGPRIYTMTDDGGSQDEVPGQVQGNDDPDWR